MAKNPNKQWDRCLYCDASIAGDDAHVASLHDPYCPHGKSLLKLGELSKAYDAEVSLRKDVQNHRDHCAEVILRRDETIKDQGCRLGELSKLCAADIPDNQRWEQMAKILGVTAVEANEVEEVGGIGLADAVAKRRVVERQLPVVCGGRVSLLFIDAAARCVLPPNHDGHCRAS